jgi:hypothetical protein
MRPAIVIIDNEGVYIKQAFEAQHPDASEFFRRFYIGKVRYQYYKLSSDPSRATACLSLEEIQRKASCGS